MDFQDPCPVKEQLRTKIIGRLLKEGSNAEEPANIALSDYSSLSSGADNSSSDCCTDDEDEEEQEARSTQWDGIVKYAQIINVTCAARAVLANLEPTARGHYEYTCAAIQQLVW